MIPITDIEQKEYIITLKNFNDLESFYNDMESEGSSVSSIPVREIVCTERRPMSRNTQYMLTKKEYLKISKDTRVEIINLHPRYLGLKADIFLPPEEEEVEDLSSSTREQSSSYFNKSTSTSNNMKNWALLRCYEGVPRSNWGSDGTTDQSGTIKLAQTGKNVDIILIDAGNPDINHPEYAVNADGTGGSRMVPFNWFQYDPIVKGSAPNTYFISSNPHSVHVSGTSAGNTQGWARDANIYNMYYAAGGDTEPTIDGMFSYVMDYARAFHNSKSINNNTGRKNPTITSNSWGWSLFPSDWAMSYITAVTYRGVRHTPSGGSTIYDGLYGVYGADTKLADLLGKENFGNRIVTTGDIVSDAGTFVSYPQDWSFEPQPSPPFKSMVYIIGFGVPGSQYVVTVQGPATIQVDSQFAASVSTGSVTITGEYIVTDASSNVVGSWSDTQTGTDGGNAEVIHEAEFDILDNQIYTITFNQSKSQSPGSTGYIAAYAYAVKSVDKSVIEATVTEITNTLLGASSLTASTTPTSGNNDDGYWTLSLPFTVRYLGVDYTSVYAGTNNYLTFSVGSSDYTGLGPNDPYAPKIMMAAGDTSVQRIYYGTEGTSPNRKYRLRVEGTASTSGTLGSPTVVYEYTFYENTNNQIDLQIGVNGNKHSNSGFTTQQLNDWGIIAGQRIPQRLPSLDADIIDAMNDGVIFVGAAGNGKWYHDVPGGLDWDNTFEMATQYPDSVAHPFYLCRGTSPTANDVNMPNICVGAIDVSVEERKVYFSDCGPGVDIWAPGHYIISSLTNGFGVALVPDERNASHGLGKISGTSMACPQVAGVLACALEVYPDMNQAEAKEYITNIAKEGQLKATGTGYADPNDINGSPNLYLYYKRERALTGNSFPKANFRLRPTSGSVYPRNRIKNRK